MTSAVPNGYMKDAQGRLVPESMVKPIDQLRNQTVLAIVDQAKNLNGILAKFKTVTFADIDAFIDTSAEQYDTKVGGQKGYITLFSFDGRYKVQRSVQELVRFDEQLQVAKSLIDECITDWASASRYEIKVLVNDAIRVNQEGQVRTQQVLGLRRLAIQDTRWKSAMDAIGNAIQVVGTKAYIRVYERIGDTENYKAISLDIATL